MTALSIKVQHGLEKVNQTVESAKKMAAPTLASVQATATKVAQFVQKHSYLFLALSLTLSMVLMPAWLPVSWAARMVVYGALESLSLARFVVTAQVFWKIFKKEEHTEQMNTLFLLTSGSNLAKIWLCPTWSIFEVAASTGAVLGTKLLSSIFSEKKSVEPKVSYEAPVSPSSSGTEPQKV
jgi:hypothetical protein